MRNIQKCGVKFKDGIIWRKDTEGKGVELGLKLELELGLGVGVGAGAGVRLELGPKLGPGPAVGVGLGHGARAGRGLELRLGARHRAGFGTGPYFRLASPLLQVGLDRFEKCRLGPHTDERLHHLPVGVDDECCRQREDIAERLFELLVRDDDLV